MKRKPKSAALRAELLQKSSDAQSSLKKASAPIIPLRSRGMPRKMTDTTPLRGIPSRVPTSGFRSPTSSQNQSRPNMTRQQAGRKDGGIKLLDIAEQPLGYAAAKKRKRQQELEEQQKRALEAQSNSSAKTEPETPVTTTPDYAVGLNTTSVYTQPATPAPNAVVKETTSNATVSASTTASVTNQNQYATSEYIKTEIVKTEPIVKTEAVASSATATSTTNILQSQTPVNISSQQQSTTANNNHIVFSIKSDGNVAASTTALITTTNASLLTTKKSDGPRLISSTTIKPAPTVVSTPSQPTLLQTPKTARPPALTAIVSSPTTMPSLTAISNTLSTQQQLSQPMQIPQQIGATKIVQIKTAPTIQVVSSNMQRPSMQNIPPLIPTQQPTILNIQQNTSLANRQPIAVQTQTSTASILQQVR